jgi:hypothetical protein
MIKVKAYNASQRNTKNGVRFVQSMMFETETGAHVYERWIDPQKETPLEPGYYNAKASLYVNKYGNLSANLEKFERIDIKKVVNA